MAVRVVTDSASDIPLRVARELGITVVPNYVVFGQQVYRDGLDISQDEFYRRLTSETVYPTTSAPSPDDFADAYHKLAQETDEIVSIHITAKMSGVCNSARLGAQVLTGKCHIEIVDSQSMSVGLGLSVIATAKEAQGGQRLEQVTQFARRTCLHIHHRSVADTLKYAIRSGRLSRAYGQIGTVLGVKTVLGMRQGEAVMVGLARTRAKALDSLYEFARGIPRVREMALGYTTEHSDAKDLAQRLQTAFPETPISVTRVGPAIGAYGGPGAVGIGIRELEGSDIAAR